MRLKKIALVLLAPAVFAASFIVAEAGYFYWILRKDVSIKKADLIVVFAGEDERIKAGYELAQSGYGDYLVVSPANEKTLQGYTSLYGTAKNVGLIVENDARTTFENAFYTRKIVERYKLESIILLTSKYHLPRSYLSLKALLSGTNTKIQIFGVDKVEMRTIYREMVKMWGSFAEMAYYAITGKVPETHIKTCGVVRFLKAVLQI